VGRAKVRCLVLTFGGGIAIDDPQHASDIKGTNEITHLRWWSLQHHTREFSGESTSVAPRCRVSGARWMDKGDSPGHARDAARARRVAASENRDDEHQAPRDVSEKRRGRPPKREPVVTAFSTFVRTVMERLALNEDALATRLNVSTKTVYAWLAGQNPRLPHLVRRGITATLRLRLGESIARRTGSPRRRARRRQP
jgi:ribosome-binding protein aMBF1 (putative translation factor)